VGCGANKKERHTPSSKNGTNDSKSRIIAGFCGDTQKKIKKKIRQKRPE
jgi:hypothetical protein